jgi:hypothetical protein
MSVHTHSIDAVTPDEVKNLLIDRWVKPNNTKSIEKFQSSFHYQFTNIPYISDIKNTSAQISLYLKIHENKPIFMQKIVGRKSFFFPEDRRLQICHCQLG